MHFGSLQYRRLRTVFSRYPGLVVVPIAWLSILSSPVGHVAYLILLVLAGGLESWRVRDRLVGPLIQVAPALAFLAAVGLLRQAGGGRVSGVGILALVPVFQAALFGRDRRELWVILTAMAALYLTPILIVVPAGQTCSAGLAARGMAEPMESVIARADRALYEAKSAGRDLARVAG